MHTDSAATLRFHFEDHCRGAGDGERWASSSLMKIFALAGMVALAGCAKHEKLSDQPGKASAQIQSWVPIGTALADAQRVMEQHYFSCSLMTNSRFGDLTNATFLLCDCREANNRLFPTVYQMWKVALVLSDGKISDVRVNTGFKGL